MMKRELIIDDSPECIRAAIIEDGMLCEIMAEKQTGDDQTESLFYGRVQSIRKSVNAAFIDIGDDLNAFLPLDEQMRIRCGEMMIVQGAAKQATATKGLRVAQRINLAGKWLVLIPDGNSVHISKKIKDPALREELAEIGNEICPDGFGMIIRTASGEVTKELLKEEAVMLEKRWREILLKASSMVKPGLLWQREKLPMRLVRDLSVVSRIVINAQSGFDALSAAKAESRIASDTEVELYEEKEQLIFDAFGIEHQIDKAIKKRIWLPCGGYLVIDPCEAMTVIDVNSGKMTLGKGIEDTAFRVNLEAADEVARQLRLRDIGGIVVIDFIDMCDEAHRRELLSRMRQAVKADRAQVNVEGMTRLGLMEMTRKRVHSSLRKTLSTGCTYCSGNGEVLSADEVARRAIRQIRRMSISGQRGPFVVKCAPSAAQVLCGMTNAFGAAKAYVLSVHGKHAEKFEIEQIGEGMSVPSGAVLLKYEDDI